MNARAIPPLGFGQYDIQNPSADAFAPALGDDVDQVEEATPGYGRSLTVLAEQRLGARHPDRDLSVLRHEEPRAGLAEAGRDLLDAGGSVRPDAVAPGQIRLLVHGDRRLDIGRASEADED